MAKRQPKTSVVEQAVLDKIGDHTRARATILTRFACGHVGAEIGVKAKAFVRFAELRGRAVEDDSRKCVDCK